MGRTLGLGLTRGFAETDGGKYKLLNKKKIHQPRKTQGREAAR